jgi:hypothetical protein
MPDRTAAFVDTSIEIARRVRERAMKNKIRAWLENYPLKISSVVVLQEFKNRVLRDVAYLLAKLHKTGSYLTTLDYITNVLPAQQHRKMRICVPVLHGLLPGASDGELTERALLYCRTLLLHGEAQFVRQVDTLLRRIDCYWAKIPVAEKKRYVSYDFGGKRCDASKGLLKNKVYNMKRSLTSADTRCSSSPDGMRDQ